MEYEVSRLVRDIRVTIDRNRKNADLLEVDINTQMLDESIQRNIVDGVRMILLSAPHHWLEAGVPFPDETITWKDKYSGQVPLPDDFVRLVAFKMSDWTYPCIEAEDEASPAYPQMKSPIKALRGVAERPRVFEVTKSDGRVLEFYSCDSEAATVEQAQYIALPLIKDDKIDIPLLCYGACVAEIGSLALLERGATELAQALQEEVKSLIA